MNKNDYIGVIRAAFAVIKEDQSDDGGFVTLSSAHADTFIEAREYRTTFASANILQCLNAVQKSFPLVAALCVGFENVTRRLAEFLLAQKSERYSFNYWSRAAQEQKTTPYPDDLDDTFAALGALHGYDSDLIDGSIFAAIAKLLIAAEVEVGGPYRTWLIDPQLTAGWRDVDLAVNSGIGAFLARFDVGLPRVVEFIEQAIKDENLISPYYPGTVHIAYFISRFYRGVEKGKILEILFSQRREDGLWATPLESAMAISALINLGFADSILEQGIRALMRKIEREGFCPSPFCIDPAHDGKKYYAGSRALTAAFIIEALAKWMAIKEKIEDSVKDGAVKNIGTVEGSSLLRKIKKSARDRGKDVPRNLRDVAYECIKNIRDEEIVLLPYRMRYALSSEAGEVIDTDILELLALGNLYGWIAYRIYDDFLDSEAERHLLPVANFFLRQLILLYQELGCVIPSLDDWSGRLIDAVDDANIWEVLHCRWMVGVDKPIIPDVPTEEFANRFAARSIAHALPAIAVLLMTDSMKSEHDIKSLVSFFRHYLIARQSHDDAHDWADDLLRGRMTPVGARMIRAWQHKHSDDILDLQGEIPELRQVFWHDEIQNVVAEIKTHLNDARRALVSIPAVKNPKALTSLLDSLAIAANRVLTERDNALKFLAAYKWGQDPSQN